MAGESIGVVTRIWITIVLRRVIIAVRNLTVPVLSVLAWPAPAALAAGRCLLILLSLIRLVLVLLSLIVR